MESLQSYNLELIVLLCLLVLYYLKQSHKFSDFNFIIYISIIFMSYAYLKNNNNIKISNFISATPEQPPFRKF